MIVKNLLPREFDRAEKILTLTRQNTQESVRLPGLSPAFFSALTARRSALLLPPPVHRVLRTASPLRMTPGSRTTMTPSS